jgi:hypothetical protein
MREIPDQHDLEQCLRVSALQLACASRVVLRTLEDDELHRGQNELRGSPVRKDFRNLIHSGREQRTGASSTARTVCQTQLVSDLDQAAERPHRAAWPRFAAVAASWPEELEEQDRLDDAPSEDHRGFVNAIRE